MKTRLFTLLMATGFVLASCESSFDSLVQDRLDENPLPSGVTASKGNADFTTYVAIGNSLTAGYRDGALYTHGQQNAYPAQLAKQFALAGGGAFNQPDINSVHGFNTGVSQPGGGLVLGRFMLDTSIPGPSPVVGGDPIQPYGGDKASLNNFGIPGMRLGQLLTPGTGNPADPAFNPYFARFASAPGIRSPLDDIVARNPTFVTLWAGNNDVLQYASSGGANPALLTSAQDFQTQFTQVMTRLATQTATKGVIADIPLLITLPYFRAVPYNAIPLDAATAGAWHANFPGLNTLIGFAAATGFITAQEATMRQLSYAPGQNAILTEDNSLTDLGPFFDGALALGQIDAATRASLAPYEQARQLKTNLPQIGSELVLLGAATVLGRPVFPGNPQLAQIIYGVSYPISDALTLTADEILAMETARQTNNYIIKQVVAGINQTVGSKRFAIWETSAATSLFSDIFGLSDGKLGTVVDGVSLAPDFSPNGVFSTDGIHPNVRGDALIANEFIKVIEAEFGASIPKVNVLALPSVTLCSGSCVSQL